MKIKAIGFPTPQITGKGSFSPPQAKELTASCDPGEYVKSETMDGKVYQGILKEWDSNVAIITLDGGGEKTAEC